MTSRTPGAERSAASREAGTVALTASTSARRWRTVPPLRATRRSSGARSWPVPRTTTRTAGPGAGAASAGTAGPARAATVAVSAPRARARRRFTGRSGPGGPQRPPFGPRRRGPAGAGPAAGSGRRTRAPLTGRASGAEPPEPTGGLPPDIGRRRPPCAVRARSNFVAPFGAVPSTGRAPAAGPGLAGWPCDRTSGRRPARRAAQPPRAGVVRPGRRRHPHRHPRGGGPGQRAHGPVGAPRRRGLGVRGDARRGRRGRPRGRRRAHHRRAGAGGPAGRPGRAAAGPQRPGAPRRGAGRGARALLRGGRQPAAVVRAAPAVRAGHRAGAGAGRAGGLGGRLRRRQPARRRRGRRPRSSGPAGGPSCCCTTTTSTSSATWSGSAAPTPSCRTSCTSRGPGRTPGGCSRPTCASRCCTACSAATWWASTPPRTPRLPALRRGAARPAGRPAQDRAGSATRRSASAPTRSASMSRRWSRSPRPRRPRTTSRPSRRGAAAAPGRPDRPQKNIVRGFLAYELMLEEHPEMRGGWCSWRCCSPAVRTSRPTPST